MTLTLLQSKKDEIIRHLTDLKNVHRVAGNKYGMSQLSRIMVLPFHLHFVVDNRFLGYAMVLKNLGDALHGAGKFDEAIAAFNESKDYFESSHGLDLMELSKICHGLGNCFKAKCDVELSLKYYERSHILACRLRPRAQAALSELAF